MPGEVDARLIGMLQASLGLADSLRDAGSTGEITVRLGREDGLMLLKLVAGANDADAEAFSQRGRPARNRAHSLRISNLTFEWPQSGAQGTDYARLISAAPTAIAAPANENLAIRFRGFGEDAPALR